MAWNAVDRNQQPELVDGRVLSEQLKEKIRAFFDRYETRRAALLPALHMIQDDLGYIGWQAMEEVAELLGIPPSDVFDTVSFYTYFWTKPRGKKVVTVCRSLSCEILGAADVLAECKRVLGIDEHDTTADGRYSLATEECLAACDHAPCLYINEKCHKSVQPADVAGLLADPGNDRLDIPRSDLYDGVTRGAVQEGVVDSMAEYEPILLKNVGKEGSVRLEVYEANGGYQALKKALKTMTPEEVVTEVKRADLRGRGGAGFPAGVKWGFLPADREVTYLCVNADESEPPTFSNRVIMESDPHSLLEGVVITGYATQSTVAYIYMRAEFTEQFHILQRAVDEAYAAGYFGKDILGSGYSLECYIHRGAGAYVCGEETGLLESLEGKRGWPRIKPPFPAIEGAFRRPTVVNNVETLCNVPHIVERGAEWFLGIGPKGSSGPKLFCISGPVNRPGCYEWSMEITCRDLIEDARFGGGMRDGRTVKAVLPGGVSMGILTADELDMKMDFADPPNYGLLGLGTAAAVVIDAETDIRTVMRNVARFFAHESCGQCTQCREGTNWMYKMTRRAEQGLGLVDDLSLLEDVSSNMGMMPGLSICGLSDGAAFALRTIVKKFRSELEGHIRTQDDSAVRIALEIVN